jgi:transketolase
LLRFFRSFCGACVADALTILGLAVLGFSACREDAQPVNGSRRSGRPSRPDRSQLERRAFSVKKRFLGMYKAAHAGHVGSSLSCAEILVFLEDAWMRDADTFVLSKGHAVAALYALLAEVNAIDSRALDSFYGEGTRLPALPPVNTIDEIPFATGSLGHGLSLCAGMALGANLNRRDRRFFCLTSDGELDEGSTWEAALFIAHRKLTNVVWLIDRNRLQGIGGTEEVLALEPLDAKLDAFGFHVVAADGHDFGSLLAARDLCTRALEERGRPVVIIANTVKGHGLRQMQDTVASHYLPMDDAQYEQALSDLAKAHAMAVTGSRDAG